MKDRGGRGKNQSELDSFYHLRARIGQSACRGTGCFVARHQNAATWARAMGEEQVVHCLGKCYGAPACTGDNERPRIEVDAPVGVVLERMVHGPARMLEEYIERRGYRALEKALAGAPGAVLEEIEASELRGRGGAGFPVGKKWRMAAEQKEREKFIVANADEGDPGAYIDRFIMEDDPHSLIEGMALAAYAVGAEKGVIYLRVEYPEAASILEHAIMEARQAGILGGNNQKDAFDIELVVGKGSYMCGEETALLNALEGKRPVARARPPYATERGLHGKPTVINNVETLANIPWIVRNGGESYQRLGFSKSRGTKVVSLNSLFNYPGLYEVEFGVTVRHIVEKLGGGLRSGRLKGVMIGGPLAGVVPPQLLDTPFGFEELEAIGGSVGHGGIVAFDERTTIPELMEYIFGFGAFESCGKCTPCRLGARRVQQLFQQALRGPVTKVEEREVREILAAIKLTSLCGFGSGLAQFGESVIRHYGEELWV